MMMQTRSVPNVLKTLTCLQNGSSMSASFIRRSSTVSTQNTGKFDWAITDMPPPSPGRGLLGRAANFDVTKHEGTVEKWNWILRFMGYMNKDDCLFRNSCAIFHSCANQSAIPSFYQALELTPNFRAQQALLLVHIWMIHRRLATEGEEGKVMQEMVFDRLWEETVLRIRHQNISELTVNKHLGEVQQLCFNSCVSYDRGFKDGNASFQDAIMKNLLDDDKFEKRSIAITMMEYIQRELKNLKKVDAKYIMEGTIPWGSPPVKSSTKSPTSDDQTILIGQKIGNWRTALDNRGKLYYWNLTTRISSWDPPSDTV